MISASRLPIAPSLSLFMIPIAPIIASLEGVSKWRKCALRRNLTNPSKIFHSVYQHFDLLDLYRFVGFLVRRTTEFLF